MRKLFFAIFFVFASLTIFAQHPMRQKVTFPKVDGYIVLKGDFHMHTSFSDGSVWPTERVSEAYHEDIDAISITDHLEIQRSIKDVTTSGDFNRSYELAKTAAEQYNILLVKGTEITRVVPPGHTNAIFIKDATPLFNPAKNARPNEVAGYDMAVKAAKDQGGFVFYNHPFHQLADDKIVMPKEVDQLIKEGKIDGIEVVNGDRFCREAYNWAIQRNLTLIANSDAHSSAPLAMAQHDISHRAMTLIMAKERSLESLHEAMDARRTLLWWRENIIGRKDLLESFVKACVPLTKYELKGNQLTFIFENVSPQRFVMEPISTDEYFIAHPVVLPPNSECRVSVGVKTELSKPVKILFRVNNAWTNYEEHLIIEYTFNRSTN
jgi:predicted metal-dependent phosphoesterase TrpH